MRKHHRCPSNRGNLSLVLGAVRRSDWLRPFYERLRAAGKPAKLALIAATRKLLHAVYSVAENRKPLIIATEQAREV